MKKIIKISLLFIITLLFMININSVKAASTSISASSTKVTKGKSVTVTASVKAGAWNLTLSGAGQSKGFVGQTATTANASASTSITFTPSKTGTYTFTLKGDITDYDTDATSDVSKSLTITVTEPETKPSGGGTTGGSSSGGSSSSGSSSSNSSSSTNNKKPSNTTTTKPEEKPKSTDSTLSGLAIKEGAISPEFKKDVKEYTLTIPYEVTEVNVTATVNDSKAKVNIEGNKDLKEGENIVKVVVTAEDESTTTYSIKVTRKRVPIALKSLVVKYQNENGELIEIPLNPAFNFDTLEYTIQDLEHWVEKINIEANPNIEGAQVEIVGADNLQTGENTITITLKIAEQNPVEGQEPKEETITYTIKVNKTKEPTLMAKISDWFRGIMGTVGTWFDNNHTKVILGALVLCIVALIGLSVYIVIDYNKYKDVIAKVKKVNEINKNSNIVEEISQEKTINNKNDRPKGGKHF